MSNEDSTNVHDMVGAYVLDALDPKERREFENHLRSCSECRQEVVDLSAIVDVLPLAVGIEEPPPGLRDRIMESVAGETSQGPKLVALDGGASQPAGRSPFSGARIALGLVAAVVILALGAWNVALQRNLHDQQQTTAQLQATTLYQRQVSRAIASGAAVSHIGSTPVARFASAAVVQPRNGESSYLIVLGLPPTPAGKVYQLWYVRGGVPASAKVFRYSGRDPEVLRVPIPAAGYSLTAVTIEPGPAGSPSPTGAKVLLGKLA